MVQYVDMWRSTKIDTANWSGVSYSPDVTFEEDGSSAHVHLATDIGSINISGGDKPTESVTTFGNKRINIQKPQEDYEVEMEVAPRDTTFKQMLFGGTLSSGAIVSGTEYTSAGTQKRWRITVTFDDGKSDGETRRFVFKDVFAISFEEKMGAEDYLQGTIKFKVPATDKNGGANIFDEYVANKTTASLNTLGASHGGAENSYVYS